MGQSVDTASDIIGDNYSTAAVFIIGQVWVM